MWRNIFEKIAKFSLILFLLAPTILPAESHAQIYEGVRDMEWNGSRCVGGGYNEGSKRHSSSVLDFNPFGNNPDITWELTNGVCAAYIAASITTIMTTKYISGYLCNNATAGALYSAGVAAGVVMSPKMISDQAQETAYCSTQVGLCADPFTAAVSCPLASACCAGVAATGLAIAGAVTGLAIIYGVANGAYQKARICGYGDGKAWKTWAKVDSDGVISSDGSTWRKGAYSGSYKKVVQDYATSGVTPSLSDKKYREYIFGGVEYEDKGDGACKNPSWGHDRRIEVLGYDSSNMKYYMTGANEAPVFACYRFLLAKGSDAEISAGLSAYSCCSKRSQNVVCIENAGNGSDPITNSYEYKFCEIGSRCNVKEVWFDTYLSKTKSNYGCVRTYSGCPYNHPLGGGTEVADYSDANDRSTMQNGCQYMNHCSILPIKPYVSQSSLTGAFFDSSCRDLKGDSQNTYGYSSNLSPVEVRGFSAPMAQCFKETIENIFFNKAGSTACLDTTETPNALTGVCQSGYKYKKGEDLSTYQKSIGQSGKSFFVRVQSALQDTVKMALSIAIMFFGISILIGGSPITKKQLVPFVLKIAFVMYFATGNEWQNIVLDGLIGGGAELADMVFRTDSLTGNVAETVTTSNGDTITQYTTDSSVDQTKLDGCQFPRYNYADSDESTRYNYKAYPSGKEYLRVWDTLDCKISRALGYGINVSVPNLVMMIMGGFFTGGAGIIFVVATLAFAFFLISLTIRALHIFILSTVSIIVLLYMSPIMVTMFMFNRTKGIFESWWKNILSFALQPMILFVYMGILLTFFDTVIMGNLTFNGDGKSVPKQAVCSGAVANTSVYCIFNPPISGPDGAVKTYDKLKVLGIGLPILTSMNQTKIATLIKAAVLMFILMSFMDKISDFAKALLGGTALSSKTMSATAMMTKASAGMTAIQKRGMGMIKKNIAPAIQKGFGKGKAAVRQGAAMAGYHKTADAPAASSDKGAGASQRGNSDSGNDAGSGPGSSSNDSSTTT